MRRVLPGAGGQLLKPFAQVSDDNRFSRAHYLLKRPESIVSEQYGGRRGWVFFGNACRADASHSLLLLVQQIQHGKGEISGILGQAVGAEAAGFLNRAGISHFRSQGSQQFHLPLPDNPLGIIGIGANNAAYSPIVGRNGAVGEGVAGFLWIPMAFHD
jgi:hypothetical protein